MPFEIPFQIFFDETALEKIAAHDVTENEVREVLSNPRTSQQSSNSSGLPTARGITSEGRVLIVVFLEEEDDPRILSVITAYEPDTTSRQSTNYPKPQGKRRRK